jgi:hypothetical protein
MIYGIGSGDAGQLLKQQVRDVDAVGDQATIGRVVCHRRHDADHQLMRLLYIAMARLLFPCGELIIGIIVDTTVLALGIFMIVMACIGFL